MKNSIDKNLFMLFQINDSLFPIGAYSHSYGLETYIQKKLVKNVDSAFEYLKCNLKSNFLYSELLAINLSYEYADKGRLDKLIRLDNILNASKSPKEIRLASQKLGSRFIKTLMSTDINYKNNNFIDYVNESKNNLPTHTVAYGTFCQSVGIAREKAIEGFLYSYTSSTITNIVASDNSGLNVADKLSPPLSINIISRSGNLFASSSTASKFIEASSLIAV